jgi:hypothetical protein
MVLGAVATEKKKKPKIQARDVIVDNRTLEAVLLDLAEQSRANDARHAESKVQAAERAAQAEARTAQIEARTARNEELVAIALQTIAAVSQDLRALSQDLRTFAQRAEDRLGTLEKANAAE